LENTTYKNYRKNHPQQEHIKKEEKEKKGMKPEEKRNEEGG